MHLKRAATALLARDTIWDGLRPLRRARVAVLTYHRVVVEPTIFRGVGAGEFRRQMEWLARHCDVIPPHELVSHRQRGSGRPAIVVTFDDGYRDFYETVCPILRRVGIRAVNFLPTHFIDTGQPFWWDLVEYAVHASRQMRIVLPWSNQAQSLDEDGRRVVIRRAKEELKKSPRPDQSPLLHDLLSRLEIEPRPAALPRQVMTWDEVRAVADISEAGGHAHTHAAMNRLNEPEQSCESETSFKRLAAETGSPPQLFAYPNGAVNRTAERSVLTAGYRQAFTTVAEYVPRDCASTLIPRIHAPATVAELAWIASGWRRSR